MKIDNPFDKKLELPQVQRKTSVANSAPYVVDMLDMAWAGVLAVFEEQAKPEHALMLLPHLLQAAEAERQLLRSEAAIQRTGAPTPPPGPPPAPR